MSPSITKHLTLRSFLGYTAATLGVLLFVAYTFFQARFLILGPQITIEERAIMQEERIVTLEGTARNITNINLNGRTIYTDENGYFKETLVLENGYTVATLRAYDRYGRQTVLTQSFVYTPKDIPVNS